MNPRLVKRAIDNIKDNKQFYGLSQAALSRSVGDHLYGINLTRLYTLKAQEKGAKGVFSVGRVQTPKLGLIVRRAREIASHVKKYYYTIIGKFEAQSGKFKAAYIPSEADPVDDQKRIIDQEFAKKIVSQCDGKSGVIYSAETNLKQDPPPLPYDLLELQSDASRKYSIKPDSTLKLTQSLREKRLITYNRSDCRYLSEEQHSDAPLVIEAIKANCSTIASPCDGANTAIKGRCFNNSNVTAHHAIIPTEAKADFSQLSDNEQKIYTLIARQYLAQFYPNKESEVTTVLINCEEHLFRASSTKLISTGWSSLFQNESTKSGDENSTTTEDLTKHKQDDKAKCTKVFIENKETQPPKHYTDSTLLQDLRRVAKYVKDPKIAALLKDKDKDVKGEQGGIGTPATRDSFIVKLIDRGFVERKSKKLISTELGQSFHDTLPEIATQPDMTALWHEQQKDIEFGKLDTMSFVKGLAKTVTDHVDEVRKTSLELNIETYDCPTCDNGRLSLRQGKFGDYWGCSNYPECKQTFKNNKGKPDAEPKTIATTDHDCGSCGNKLIRRVSKKGKGKTKRETPWYGCSAFPKCKQTYFEKDGVPDFGTKKAV